MKGSEKKSIPQLKKEKIICAELREVLSYKLEKMGQLSLEK